MSRILHLNKPAIYCYRDSTETDFVESIKQLLEKDKGSVLCCYLCYEAITGIQEQIQVLGSHSHRFSNPANFQFQIGCFREAFGCLHEGFPTLEYTWFPGYHWQMALCNQCLEHLGWFFSKKQLPGKNNTNSFYGLILNKLIKRDSQAD